MVVRWKLFDPSTSEEHTFPVNPSEGGSPTYAKTITQQSVTAPGGRTVLFEGSDEPTKFSFSGSIISQDQLNALRYWWAKRRQVRVTDDLGRQFFIYIVSYTATRKHATTHPFRHSYQVDAIVVDWP